MRGQADGGSGAGSGSGRPEQGSGAVKRENATDLHLRARFPCTEIRVRVAVDGEQMDEDGEGRWV